MSEEEIKAIEILRFSPIFRGRKPENDCLEIVLNLIDKLQKELDKKDICLKACEDNLIKERQLRIKQDKVIKLMINWIDDRCFYSDDYGNNCEIIQDSCFNPIKDCNNCIKEYFYKKAEEENVN